MVQRNGLFCALVTLLLVVTACQPLVHLPQEATSIVQLEPETVAKIEKVVHETIKANGVPGFALGIIREGQVVYAKGFGVERIGMARPITLHSRFGTGSVGKTATATAVMQLVADGKIDLDTLVTAYLPYFQLADTRYKEITIRHLLTHRSGLPEIEDWDALYRTTPIQYDDGVLERYLRTLGDVELLFAPGEQWSYSGIGYDLLAAVIAKVSGQTFEAYLADHITGPLGMTDTLLMVKQTDTVFLASPHVRSATGAIIVNDYFPYRREHAPTSPLYSSLADLLRYTMMHLNRGELDGTRILPAESYDELWTVQSETGWGESIPLLVNYGAGWFLSDLDGHPIAAHLGIDTGFSALIALAPKDDVAVIAITNYFDWQEFSVYSADIGIAVLQMILGVEAAQPKAATTNVSCTAFV